MIGHAWKTRVVACGRSDVGCLFRSGSSVAPMPSNTLESCCNGCKARYKSGQQATAQPLLFSTTGFSTFDRLVFGLDFRLLLQPLDARTTPKNRLLYVLDSRPNRLCGRVHPENMREHSDLPSFLHSRTTFCRMTEVYDKCLSRRNCANVRKSDIAVKDVRPMD
jgi:hypothetical protein